MDIRTLRVRRDPLFPPHSLRASLATLQQLLPRLPKGVMSIQVDPDLAGREIIVSDDLYEWLQGGSTFLRPIRRDPQPN